MSTILIISLIFNIAALITPFYTAKVFMKAPYTFTLPNSVLVMWNHHLLIIAILIFVFSIIFHFLKLTTLFYIWFLCKDSSKRKYLITLIGPLGKWSMLDIFVTILLIVMANNQLMITSSLQIGVYFFLMAIFLSVISALIIENLIFSKNIKSVSTQRLFIQKIEQVTTTRRVLVFFLLLTTLVTLIITINSPFIKIDDFFLANNEYSIITSITTLFNSSILLTVFVSFTLIICPLFHIVGLMILWTIKLTKKNNYRVERFIHVVSIFNMLDVFCLGLLIFISEGSKLITTKEEPGLYILLIFILCAYLIPIFIKGTHKNYLQFIKK